MIAAAIQMVSGTDVHRNLDAALQAIAVAAAHHCELVALPEYFCLLGKQDTDKIYIAEDLGKGLLQDALKHAAQQHRIWIVAGTLPLQGSEDGHVFNSCLVFNPAGELIVRYDKMHLFAFDNGIEHYDESRILQAGRQPVGFDLWSVDGHCWRIGLSVCYDLRFPELYRSLDADVLLVPSAFTFTTGNAHWETLLRARAIENLAYVVAPAQGGLHENGRRTWGHSMIVDPWGEVLQQCALGNGLIMAKLDYATLMHYRQQLPALKHRLL